MRPVTSAASSSHSNNLPISPRWRSVAWTPKQPSYPEPASSTTEPSTTTSSTSFPSRRANVYTPPHLMHASKVTGSNGLGTITGGSGGGTGMGGTASSHLFTNHSHSTTSPSEKTGQGNSTNALASFGKRSGNFGSSMGYEARHGKNSHATKPAPSSTSSSSSSTTTTTTSTSSSFPSSSSSSFASSMASPPSTTSTTRKEESTPKYSKSELLHLHSTLFKRSSPSMELPSFLPNDFQVLQLSQLEAHDHVWNKEGLPPTSTLPFNETEEQLIVSGNIHPEPVPRKSGMPNGRVNTNRFTSYSSSSLPSKTKPFIKPPPSDGGHSNSSSGFSMTRGTSVHSSSTPSSFSSSLQSMLHPSAQVRSEENDPLFPSSTSSTSPSYATTLSSPSGTSTLRSPPFVPETTQGSSEMKGNELAPSTWESTSLASHQGPSYLPSQGKDTNPKLTSVLRASPHHAPMNVQESSSKATTSGPSPWDTVSNTASSSSNVLDPLHDTTRYIGSSNDTQGSGGSVNSKDGNGVSNLSHMHSGTLESQFSNQALALDPSSRGGATMSSQPSSVSSPLSSSSTSDLSSSIFGRNTYVASPSQSSSSSSSLLSSLHSISSTSLTLSDSTVTNTTPTHPGPPNAPPPVSLIFLPPGITPPPSLTPNSSSSSVSSSSTSTSPSSSFTINTWKATSWFYRDPNGFVQGPFDSKMMQNWFLNQYFHDDLPIQATFESTLTNASMTMPSFMPLLQFIHQFCRGDTETPFLNASFTEPLSTPQPLPPPPSLSISSSSSFMSTTSNAFPRQPSSTTMMKMMASSEFSNPTHGFPFNASGSSNSNPWPTSSLSDDGMEFTGAYPSSSSSSSSTSSTWSNAVDFQSTTPFPGASTSLFPSQPSTSNHDLPFISSPFPTLFPPTPTYSPHPSLSHPLPSNFVSPPHSIMHPSLPSSLPLQAPAQSLSDFHSSSTSPPSSSSSTTSTTTSSFHFPHPIETMFKTLSSQYETSTYTLNPTEEVESTSSSHLPSVQDHAIMDPSVSTTSSKSSKKVLKVEEKETNAHLSHDATSSSSTLNTSITTTTTTTASTKKEKSKGSTKVKDKAVSPSTKTTKENLVKEKSKKDPNSSSTPPSSSSSPSISEPFPVVSSKVTSSDSTNEENQVSASLQTKVESNDALQPSLSAWNVQEDPSSADVWDYLPPAPTPLATSFSHSSLHPKTSPSSSSSHASISLPSPSSGPLKATHFAPWSNVQVPKPKMTQLIQQAKSEHEAAAALAAAQAALALRLEVQQIQQQEKLLLQQHQKLNAKPIGTAWHSPASTSKALGTQLKKSTSASTTSTTLLSQVKTTASIEKMPLKQSASTSVSSELRGGVASKPLGPNVMTQVSTMTKKEIAASNGKDNVKEKNVKVNQGKDKEKEKDKGKEKQKQKETKDEKEKDLVATSKNGPKSMTPSVSNTKPNPSTTTTTTTIVSTTSAASSSSKVTQSKKSKSTSSSSFLSSSTPPLHEELIKWTRQQLKSLSGIQIHELVSLFSEFPVDDRHLQETQLTIATMVLDLSTSIDGRSFAAEFTKRRRIELGYSSDTLSLDFQVVGSKHKSKKSNGNGNENALTSSSSSFASSSPSSSSSLNLINSSIGSSKANKSKRR